MKLLQWWADLNGTKQLIVGVSFLLALGGSGALIYADFRDLPQRMNLVEEQVVENSKRLDSVNRKLDEALCILVQTENENPLDCIENPGR